MYVIFIEAISDSCFMCVVFIQASNATSTKSNIQPPIPSTSQAKMSNNTNVSRPVKRCVTTLLSPSIGKPPADVKNPPGQRNKCKPDVVSLLKNMKKPAPAADVTKPSCPAASESVVDLTGDEPEPMDTIEPSGGTSDHPQLPVSPVQVPLCTAFCF